MHAIEFEHNLRYRRVQLRCADPVNAIEMDSQIFAVRADRVYKVKNDAIARLFHRGFDGSAQGNFDAQILAFLRRNYAAQSCSARTLGTRASRQKHQHRNRVLKVSHSGAKHLATSLAAGVALIAIDAVVDVPRNVVVLEIVGVIAAMASRALEDGVVVRIRMARGAHVIGVAVAGRELRVLSVIECGPRPRCRVVAGLAGRREELRLRRVPWIRRVVVVRLVAPNAGRRQRGVVVVHMAVAALPRRDGVRPSQWECCVVVVERRIGPDDRVVADLARRRESCRCVRRVIGARVILLMARVTEDAV